MLMKKKKLLQAKRIQQPNDCEDRQLETVQIYINCV
jgi:hypothetical protein